MTTERTATRAASGTPAKQQPAADPEPMKKIDELAFQKMFADTVANIAAIVQNGQPRAADTTASSDAEAERRKKTAQFAYDLLGEMLTRRTRRSLAPVDTSVQITINNDTNKSTLILSALENATALLRLANGDVYIVHKVNNTYPSLTITGRVESVVSIILIEDGRPVAVSCPAVDVDYSVN